MDKEKGFFFQQQMALNVVQIQLEQMVITMLYQEELLTLHQ